MKTVSRADQKRLESLSPFELKDTLISLANDNTKANAITYLNAGRGNPNWIATEPREAFFLLGKFGLEEARLDWDEWDGIAGAPQKKGIAARFTTFLERNRKEPGADLLKRGLEHGVSKLGFDADAYVWELADAIIGDHYPEPPRMLHHAEQWVKAYLTNEMYAGKAPKTTFDLFATEGGTAAMCYIFDTAIVNKILAPGDTIALMTPIFTPYLEIPELDKYNFKVVHIEADKLNQDGLHIWQYSEKELAKLADPNIKGLFLVNPSNPPSMMLTPETMAYIKKITDTTNPGLTIITDDVYGTFINGFESLMSTVPRNTIGVYSFSKYFGCTGWRLGVIVVNQDNIFDDKLKKLPAADRKDLNHRYSTLTLEPEKIKFIDRLVADSRSVALNHTGGLSLPQQMQMLLFSMFAVLDDTGNYKSNCQSIIDRRLHALTKGLGVKVPASKYGAHYYVELDLMRYIETTQSPAFAAWMKANFEPVDPLFRLAEKGSVVLMNGGGFDGPQWSVRVSLANLKMEAYEQIGGWLREIMEGYLAEFEKSGGASAAKSGAAAGKAATGMAGPATTAAAKTGNSAAKSGGALAGANAAKAGNGAAAKSSAAAGKPANASAAAGKAGNASPKTAASPKPASGKKSTAKPAAKASAKNHAPAGKQGGSR
jgi:aspartate 4-decarboxylase